MAQKQKQQKHFYVAKETFDQFEQLKQKYGISGESEAFAKVVEEAYKQKKPFLKRLFG